jgi:hypothetical protein
MSHTLTTDSRTTDGVTGPGPFPGPVDQVDAALTALHAQQLPAPGWAYLAAEAIRALNHATLTPGAYPYPGDVYAVIGDLEALLQRLPQALHQTGGALEAMDDAGRVVDTAHPGEPAVTSVTVIGVAEDLAETALYVQAAARPLAVAHTQAARLAHTPNHTTDGSGAGER